VHPQRGADPHVFARRTGQRGPGYGEPVRELLRGRPARRPHGGDSELLKQRLLSAPGQGHDRLQLQRVADNDRALAPPERAGRVLRFQLRLLAREAKNPGRVSLYALALALALALACTWRNERSSA